MSRAAMVAWVCQPQYWVQKPEVSLTSGEVSTKYTPFLSFGSVPLAMAVADDRLDAARRTGWCPSE